MKRLGVFNLPGRQVSVRSSSPLDDVLSYALHDLHVGPEASGGLFRRGGSRLPTLTVERFADNSWSVSWPDAQRYVGSDADMALYDALCALNEAAARSIADQGGVGLHGGSVSIDGAAVVLVGHSGSGKSTLTARLVQRGHEFVADEIAGVRSDGVDGALKVVPFARPIGLRAHGAELAGIEIPDGPYSSTYPWRPTCGDVARHSVRLGAVVIVDRNEADEVGLRSIEAAEALQRLANNTLGTEGIEPEAFRRLEAVVRSVPTAALNPGGLDEAAAAVEGFIRDA